jgi:TPR repeat protein
MKKKQLSLLILAALTQPAVASIYDQYNSSSSSSDYSSEPQALMTEFDFNIKNSGPFIWQSEEGNDWRIVRLGKIQERKIRSAAIDVGESSVLKTQFVSEGGQIAFELDFQGAQYNRLTFYINDEEKQVYTTRTNQNVSAFELPAEGTLVTVKWVFKKNAQSANNKDLARLDNIRISGTMDTDLDNFNDAWELKYFGNLTTLSSRDDANDYDKDGMTNQQEHEHYTDPTTADADNDGLFDNHETEIGSNPNRSDPRESKVYHAYESLKIYHMGLSYLERQDYQSAFEFFESAAEQRAYAPAMHELGHMYAQGLFVTANQDQAVLSYKSAANSQHTPSQMLLYQKYQSGDGVIKNNAESINWLKQAVANKHPEALVELAKLYETGSNNEITYDIKAAYDLYFEAALLDNAEARYNLARFYEQGLGVERDLDEAKWWNRRARDSQDSDSSSMSYFSSVAQ